MARRRSIDIDDSVQFLFSKQIDSLYNKLNSEQKDFYAAIMSHKVIFVDEKAGTGKTFVAVYAGLEFIKRGKKLIYVRFPSERGEQLGYTPGTLEDKEVKYMWPLYEALQECGLQEGIINDLRARGIIETRSDTTERGRNYKNAYVIIDEAQNARDIEQLRLILTRLCDSSVAVVIGHSGQTDSEVKRYGSSELNAFQFYTYHMTKKDFAVKCTLSNNYRGEVAQWADEIDITLEQVGDSIVLD